MDAMESLDRLATNGYTWNQTAELAKSPPPGLIDAIEKRYAERPSERTKLIQLLGRIDGAHALLLQLLSSASGPVASSILRELTRHGVAAPVNTLERLLDHCDEDVIEAVQFCGAKELAPRLAIHLHHRELGWRVARALGVLGHRESTIAIAVCFEAEERFPDRYAAALEWMGDSAAVPYLLRGAQSRDRARAWAAHHALVSITGRDPLVRRDRSYEDAVADAWSLPARAAPELAIVALSPREASLTLDEGRRRLCIDLPPVRGGAWTRWSMALCVDGVPLYTLSSHCGTCASILVKVGDLGASLPVKLNELRQCVQAIAELTPTVIQQLAPLLHPLASGHYLASLVDLAVERIDTPERSWLERRGGGWPGTTHFQTIQTAVMETHTAFVIVAPSQSLEALNEEVISQYERHIQTGARPVTLVLSWLEDRDHSDGEWSERFLMALVLDGHHKLAAYARCNVPARILFLTHLESCSTTDPSRAVRETLRALSQSA